MGAGRIYWGQILAVLGMIAISAVVATHLTADALGYQPQLGPPDLIVAGIKLYAPWKFFLWWATQGGAQTLNAIAQDEAPFARVGKTTVAVEILSVVRASPTSFQLRWRETTYSNGTVIDIERFTGVASVVIDPPSSPERLSRNPLGLYVHAFTYSRDLQQ